MQTGSHSPRQIESLFLPAEATVNRELISESRLWMPEETKGACPLIIRVTDGTDASEEAAFFTEKGFAVYACCAQQKSMENDTTACRTWMETLEETVDELLMTHSELDAQNVFIDGWMAAYLIFHTHRFRAAVQRPALMHRATAFGNCVAGEYQFSDKPLLEQMKQLAAQSVLVDVDNCKTPCLVLYHEDNLRYSREQSEQLYAAMKDRNDDIPCRMAVFPELTSENWKRSCMEEVLAWWKRFTLHEGGETT